MKRIFPRKVPIVSSVAAAPAFAAAYRRIGWRVLCTFSLLVSIGMVCGSLAMAQTAQFLNWTTPVGGSAIDGPLSVAVDGSGSNIYAVTFHTLGPYRSGQNTCIRSKLLNAQRLHTSCTQL